MLPLVVWALSTGFVTGAVWFGVLSHQRQVALAARQAALAELQQAETRALEDVHRRITELEARLESVRQLEAPRSADVRAAPREVPEQDSAVVR